MFPTRYVVEATNGRNVSASIVNGTPACCYIDAAGNLRFARNASANGSGAWTLTTIVAVGANSFNYPSLLVVQGFPAVSYQNTVGGVTGVYYVRASNNTGSAWGAPVTVSSTAGIVRGGYCSLVNVNGNPAIAFRNTTSNNVEFVRSTNSTGTTWSSIVPVTVPSGDVLANINLFMFNGKPAIIYFDSTNFVLKYAYSNTSTGLTQPSVSRTWNLPITIDNNTAGSNVSVTNIDDAPFISYYQVLQLDNTVSRLKTLSFHNVFGLSAKAQPVTVSTNTLDGPTSSVNVDGRPVVAYRNSYDSSLNVMFPYDGTASWYSVVYDNSVNSGEYLSAISTGGKIGIFYTDSTGGNIMYVY